MRKLLILFLPILILCGLCWLIRSQDHSLHSQALSRNAFDKSLSIKELGRKFILHRSKDRQMRTVARQLILQRKSEGRSNNQSSIPHIIHQIWTSNTPLPDHLARASKMVQQQHPGFRYILWRPQDFTPLLQSELGDYASSLPPEVIRDTVASIVLLQYGGIVVDLEAECVHPITSLLPLGDCLIGFEPPLGKPKGRRRLFLSSSVLAAAPAHPLIKSYLKEMLARARTSTKKSTVDPHWITQDALTSVVSQLSPDQGRPLLLSPSYFCPVSPRHIRHLKKILNCEVRRGTVQKLLKTLRLSSAPLYSDISRETIFVHMTGGRNAKHFFDDSQFDTQAVTQSP